MIDKILKKAIQLKVGNNYVITDIQITAIRGNRIYFTTLCVNEYGDVYDNDDLWCIQPNYHLWSKITQWVRN